MFGPGQPLDSSKYFIIVPDEIGHGKSSKPSDGSRTTFPKYDYVDMVDAQYRLVKDGLGVKHLRLVIQGDEFRLTRFLLDDESDTSGSSRSDDSI